MADHSNSYFANVGRNLSSSFEDTTEYLAYLPNDLGVNFSFVPVSVSDLEIILKQLSNASPGHDDIPLEIFKAHFDLLSDTILLICNESLKQGIFPDQMKKARVIPIYKDGDKAHICNYRPISILNSMSKILEKIVALQLMSFLNTNNIISTCQNGFRIGFSTETAINSFLSDIYKAYENNEFTICILLDLKKAFDTISHKYLLRKLLAYGIRNVELRWFVSYFENRQQFVSINGVSSSLLPVLCGVAQGSILGPLLFILYINDIIRSSNLLKFNMYADDTAITYATKNLSDSVPIICHELDKVSRWLYCNHLSLNLQKTIFLVFHKQRSPVPSDFPPIYWMQCNK